MAIKEDKAVAGIKVVEVASKVVRESKLIVQ